MRHRVRIAALLPVAALAVAACTARPPFVPPDAGPPADAGPAPPAAALDVLVVIDNSNSAVGDIGLTNLRLAALLAPLGAAHPGLDVHLGVVSSDLGAGAFTPPSCQEPGGDQGILQNEERTSWEPRCAEAHLVDPADRFLRFRLAADGSATDANFVGAAGAAFDCYRALGVGGCGFQHQLASARAALAGCATDGGCAQPANAGFLRSDAYLLLVVLTDEDDCSAPPDSELFDTRTQPALDGLGCLASYRCFEYGVVCGGLPVGREAGSHEACVPGSFDPDPTHQLVPVGDLVRDLKTLKPHPRMVYAAVFAGAPAPVDVDLDVNQCANLAPSGCGTADTVFGGCADPGIRLAAFTRGFDADRGRFYDITATLADEAFGQIGLDLATALRGD